MAKVEGQIESLKKLKETLNQKGITRFNSIGEIETFIKSYEYEKNEISKKVENGLNLELQVLQSDLIKFQKNYDTLKANVTNEIDNKIKTIKEKLIVINEKVKDRLFIKILLYPKIAKLKSEISKLQQNYEKIINKQTSDAEKEVLETKNKLDDYLENKDRIINERVCQDKMS